MAKTDTFHVSVITPERAVLETQASFVAFPAHDGEVGILKNRAPFLFKLGAGKLRVESPEGDQALFIDGGFAQMVDNRLTFLTEQAKPLSELDRGVAARALAEAKAMRITDDATFKARERAIQSAQQQLKLAS